MGTIVKRKRSDGTIAYRAQIILKKGGKVIWSESETFDRHQAAKAWVGRREDELRKPGGTDRPEDPTLGEVIDQYIKESVEEFGRTKSQVLRTIKKYPIAELKCSEVTSPEIVAFARSLPGGPSTTANYLAHLAPIFLIAEPAWKYPLDKKQLADARVVAKKFGLTGISDNRDRRPTLDELDILMEHFGRSWSKMPMQKIVAFAIFSTRRQDEITRIRWEDYENGRVKVRDMKHPESKSGNHVWCDLTPEAESIIKAMPRGADTDPIFPFKTSAVQASFERACLITGINTEDMPAEERLRFHDLRHDGVSRLFEMGRTIPQAASVSGHRSWSSLQRYTHLKQEGDKYLNWKWLEAVTR
jgi:integrase